MENKKKWIVEFESLANRELKKLKKKQPKLRRAILDEVKKLKEDPLMGEELKGDLAGYRKLKVKYQSNNYRIAYKIIDNEVLIVIVKVDVRENFYKKLRLYLKLKKYQ